MKRILREVARNGKATPKYIKEKAQQIVECFPEDIKKTEVKEVDIYGMQRREEEKVPLWKRIALKINNYTNRKG